MMKINNNFNANYNKRTLKPPILPTSSINKELSFKGVDTFKRLNPHSNKLFEYLFGLKNIVRFVDKDITAGETLATGDNSFFKFISNLGTKIVIDLREFDKNYQEKCQKNGIKYVSLPFTHVLRERKDLIFDYENNGKVQDNFVKQIVTLVENFKLGNAYLGCQYGVDRTNFALVLEYIFNYNSTHKAPKIFPSNYTTRNALLNKNINLVKKIIKRLSSEQREILNLPEEFDEVILPQRIGAIVKENTTGITKDILQRLKHKICDLIL